MRFRIDQITDTWTFDRGSYNHLSDAMDAASAIYEEDPRWDVVIFELATRKDVYRFGKNGNSCRLIIKINGCTITNTYSKNINFLKELASIKFNDEQHLFSMYNLLVNDSVERLFVEAKICTHSVCFWSRSKWIYLPKVNSLDWRMWGF